MVCLRPQGGLVDTLRNETRYRSSPVPLFALARPPRMGDGHFLRAFLGETTCPVTRIPLEKCPDRTWTVRNRLGVGCRGSFLRLVKKDPHHRRGSFCRPGGSKIPTRQFLTSRLGWHWRAAAIPESQCVRVPSRSTPAPTERDSCNLGRSAAQAQEPETPIYLQSFPLSRPLRRMGEGQGEG